MKFKINLYKVDEYGLRTKVALIATSMAKFADFVSVVEDMMPEDTHLSIEDYQEADDGDVS